MKHKQTLRRGLGVLLSLVMCLSLLPATALADEPVTATADFTADDTTEALALLGDNAQWNSGTKTLTLSGVDFTTTNPTAVKLPADATINLVGENTITSTNPDTNTDASYGIYAVGNLTITGGGTLTVRGGAALYNSNGILVKSGNLTITGCTVNAYGNGNARTSRGIEVTSTVEITGGTVNAYGSDSTKYSYGIYAGYVNISDGTVTATGGNSVTDTSVGIVANKTINISGDDTVVNATGGTATSASFGIWAKDYDEADVIISGGTVKATGSTATTSYGIHVGTDGEYRTFNISGGDVIAKGNSALSHAPNLSGYTNYQWRIGSDADYTASTTAAYTYSAADTYVEFSPGPITYTVSFDANGGSGTMADVTVVSGSEYTLPDCAFTAPVGKRFKAWSVGGTTHAVGDSITISLDTIVVAVWEDDPDADCYQTADFTSGDGSAALALLNDAKTASAADSTWDSATKTLTLKGVSFSTTAAIAVQLPGGSTIVLAEGTKNTITSKFESAAYNTYSFGIYVDGGDLTIKGSGQLAVTGGTAQSSDGIAVFSGSLTIDSGTVTATGGEARGSYGIYTDNGVTINGGTVTATGSSTTRTFGSSHGIVTNKDVTINGGTVTATGGEAKSSSYGIWTNQGMTISGGHVTAQTLGDASTRNRSALSAFPGLSVYTGCYWRTDPDDYYNDTAYPYSQAHTYVEFAPEGKTVPIINDLPKTGDDSNVLLWIVLLLASGLGITGTVVYGRRSKTTK